MNPVHIYFKEIDIDQNQSFTINFAKENKIENVLFDGFRTEQIRCWQNEHKTSAERWKNNKSRKQKRTKKKISEEIQELIKQNKEPNLTFIISHPETNSIEIPFVKKNETELIRANKVPGQ